MENTQQLLTMAHVWLVIDIPYLYPTKLYRRCYLYEKSMVCIPMKHPLPRIIAGEILIFGASKYLVLINDQTIQDPKGLKQQVFPRHP